MKKLFIGDLDELSRIIRQRRRSGASRFDEVWEGVYVMSPQPNNEHLILASLLSFAFHSGVDPSRVVAITQGGNVSDRHEGWRKNFRCPDVLVFLAGNPAEDRGSHWLGGPDFAVEILSPRDRSRKKFAFYAGVGVRELLLVDRKPWRLELYRLVDGSYEAAGTSEPDRPEVVTSHVLDLNFRLDPGTPRPRIEVSRPADGMTWIA